MGAPSMAGEHGLSLRVLGAPSFVGDGADAAAELLTLPKRLALLVYLSASLARGFRRRDELLALLWPESDASHARNSLRQSLHLLRRCLPPGAVITRGSRDVALSEGALRLDSELFEYHLDHGREAEALALYQGDFLQGCHLADSPGFEEWTETERTRLRRRAVRGALVLARQLSRNGDLAGAAEWARSATRQAPLDEEVLFEGIDVLQGVGDRAGAAALHAAAVTRFRSELGVTIAPLPTTHSRPLSLVGDSHTAVSHPDERGTATLRNSSSPSLTRPRAVSPAVRRQYLQARTYSAQRSPATIGLAIDAFEGVLHEAPHYAEAHAGLAFALAQATVYVGYPGVDTWPRVRVHATTAIRLDATLGEAHAMLAQATLCHDYDWTAAERMYRRAVALDPLSEVPSQSFALYMLTASGRIQEALAVFDRSRDVTPHTPGLSTFYAMACVYGRLFVRARDEVAAVLDTQPEFAQAHWVHGMALEGLGRPDDAMSAFETGMSLTNGSSLMLSQLGRACALAGHEARARNILDQLDARGETAGPAAYFRAEIHATLGDADAAIAQLHVAYRQRNPILVFAGVMPGLDPLRDDPRLRDLLRRIGIRNLDPRVETRTVAHSLVARTGG